MLVARNVIQKSLSLPRSQATAIAEKLDPERLAEIADLSAGQAGAVRAILDRPGPSPPAPPEGRPVCLRGFMNRALGNGPSNGMYALQKAILERQAAGLAPWLRIDCTMPRDDEMAWYWNYQDVPELLQWDKAGRPWVCGPCVLFQSAFAPGAGYGEREICLSPHCRLFFTESAWYGRLIQYYLGPKSRKTIVLWPFPIDPVPGGPVFPAKYDLLIFQKSGPNRLAVELALRYPRSIQIVYGQYGREQLFEAARQSRACVYLSNDDRGPLALAEILLAGCPAAGIERGAPWVCQAETSGVGRGALGVAVDHLNTECLAPAIDAMLAMDRQAVRHAALAFFDPARITGVVFAALEEARRE